MDAAMDELKCISCSNQLRTSTGKLYNNVWTVKCPACSAVNVLTPDPTCGGRLVAERIVTPPIK